MIASEERPVPQISMYVSRNQQSRAWNAVLDLHGVIFARLNRAMLRDFGISLAKYDMLAQVHAHADGLTQGELSRRLKVTGGNVSGLVRRMTAEDLLARTTAPEDRRAVIVTLTPKGRNTFEAARAHHDAMLGEWLGGIAEPRLADLCQQLSEIQTHVEASAEVTCP